MEQDKYPVVISMPGNGVHPAKYPVASSYDPLNEYQVCEKGEEVAVLALGDFFQLGEEAARSIEKETGKKVTLINPRFASGLDEKLLSDLKENHRVVVTLEDGILEGGFGHKVAGYYSTSDMKVLNFGLKKEFYDRYDAEQLLKENHLTKELIMKDVMKLLHA